VRFETVSPYYARAWSHLLCFEYFIGNQGGGWGVVQDQSFQPPKTNVHSTGD
jgi:hypothetical protein